MSWLSLPEVRELRALYLVANTPLFLYRHLRRSATVQHMADEHSANELAALIARVDAEDRQSPATVAIAYGCVVALTYRPSDDADQAIGGLNIQHLRWIPQIFSIWSQGRIGHSSTKITLPRIQVPAARVPASSTDIRITLPGER